jgi:hypothetical protein
MPHHCFKTVLLVCGWCFHSLGCVDRWASSSIRRPMVCVRLCKGLISCLVKGHLYYFAVKFERLSIILRFFRCNILETGSPSIVRRKRGRTSALGPSERVKSHSLSRSLSLLTANYGNRFPKHCAYRNSKMIVSKVIVMFIVTHHCQKHSDFKPQMNPSQQYHYARMQTRC